MTPDDQWTDDKRWIELPEELVFVVRDGDLFHIAPVAWSIDANEGGNNARILKSVLESADKGSALGVARLEVKGLVADQAVRDTDDDD